MKRPRGVTAIAAYHALFSALLLGRLAWQAIVHRPAAGWLDAAPVLLMLLFLALIPAVLCIGLWIMDEGARIAVIVFTLLHMITTVLYLEHSPGLWRPWARMGMDVAIVAVLMLPSIRRAFREQNRLVFDVGEIGR